MRTRTPWFFCFQHFAFGRFGRTAPTLTLVLSAALYLILLLFQDETNYAILSSWQDHE